MLVIPWTVVPCESVGFGWRRGSMSWDLASDGFGANSSRERAVVSGGDRRKRRIGARDSYDPTERIYKLKFDHVYIADL
ncbi:hypothetical protein EHI44_17830 [Rhizobium leguminosarum]|uniref:hypothetical protein n=1 Tax=Rhizobium leguminosarum TaxID=384 RepID=UPI000FED6C65|nr:hypothetical protein [Rhizobium leguminosarum]NZD48460.1 hypothetical protein [Rhizobium leguminosarum]RWY84536.1 hypothetical protein EHI44_17830 [Rhizobium leguminosarum]